MNGVDNEYGPDWSALWSQVAVRMSEHLTVGREHLLNEYMLRVVTLAVLEANGVLPDQPALGYQALGSPGGRVDLMLDPPAGTAIEFTFPRDSPGTTASRVALGELLRDLLRVSAVTARQRWVVQILSGRMRRYLSTLGSRYSLSWAATVGDTLEVAPHALAALPRTVLDALTDGPGPGLVRARCTDIATIGPDLKLVVYLVDPVGLVDLEPGPPAEPIPGTARDGELATTQTRDGARLEILKAARAVLERKGTKIFTTSEIIAEMRERGSGYADDTIRTMLSAHLRADASGFGVAPYEDFERVHRGHYRFRQKLH